MACSMHGRFQKLCSLQVRETEWNGGKNRSMFEIRRRRSFESSRRSCNTLTSSCIRCDVPDRTDLVQGACKPRLNVNSLCSVGSLCNCQTSACFTAVQYFGLADQGISMNFEQGKSFLSSSKHPGSL